MSSDETYLEAFIETLSTLPHQIRRNMDLMRDLDASCSTSGVRLHQLHQQYVRQAEEKVMQLEIVHKQPGGKIGIRTLSGDAVIMPTTRELMDFTNDEDMYCSIDKLQQETLQKSDEKVAIAQQAYEIIDATVQRLDRDLVEMETLLQANGSFQSAGDAAPKVNDLAACQPTPGSEWILGKILEHDSTTGMYTIADEDTESNKGMPNYETILINYHVLDSATHCFLYLSVFHLPEEQVVLSGIDNLKRGDIIYAVYPDTTSFYQATVVQAPRKGSIGSGAFAMVNFVDDSDEFGVTHDKAILLKHIMYPP